MTFFHLKIYWVNARATSFAPMTLALHSRSR